MSRSSGRSTTVLVPSCTTPTRLVSKFIQRTSRSGVFRALAPAQSPASSSSSSSTRAAPEWAAAHGARRLEDSVDVRLGSVRPEAAAAAAAALAAGRLDTSAFGQGAALLEVRLACGLGKYSSARLE